MAFILLLICVPDSPMSWGGDEVQAAVDSAVGHLPSVHPGFWVQVVFELAVYVVDDWLPAAWHKWQLPLRIKDWEAPPWFRNVRGVLRIVSEGLWSVLGWSCGDPYQLLLSTASPNPGVSTIVSSSWTPPSFTKTLACSTWHRRQNKGHIVFTSATNSALKRLN